MKHPATAQSIGQRIDEILAVHEIQDLVRRYFDTDLGSPFAGASFDTIGTNRPDVFDVDDLLVLNLLDERVSPPEVRRLLSGEFNERLSNVPKDVDLWNASTVDLAYADSLGSALRRLPGIGSTRSAKLCARKRPRLLPIYDSVVERVLQLNRRPWWVALRGALSDEDRRLRLDGLDPHVDRYEPTTLRLLDVAVWMVGSNATTARNARTGAELLSPDPLW